MKILRDGHEWAKIEGNSEDYAVCKQGYVWSYKRYPKPPLKLKYSLTNKFKDNHPKKKLRKDGSYPYVCLTFGEIQKSVTVHRLIAETFLENPGNLPCVNHIDGNKENNTLENLEWVSYSYNTKHAYENGLVKLSDEFKSKVKDKNLKLIKGEITDYKTKYRYNKLSDDLFEEAGVPSEVKNIIKVGASPLEFWNKICTLFDLLNMGLSYREVSKQTGLSVSGISRILAGKRIEGVKDLYDKYAHLEQYRINYIFWSKK